MKKTVNILNLIALIVLFAGCTLRPVDNTTLGVEIPGETLENLLTPFMYSYSPSDNGTYAPYFKLTWEYQGNEEEKIIPVSENTDCHDFLMGNKTSIPEAQKIFTINDIPVGSELTVNLELFDAYGFALYSSKTVRENITAQENSLTLELYSTSPVVYYDFSKKEFYGVADDDDNKEQIFTLSKGESDLTYYVLQPRSFPYIREKPEDGNKPRAHCGTMIATKTPGRAVIPPGSNFGPVEEPLSITLEPEASSQTPQWVAGGTDFTQNKIWAVHENMSESPERILCYGGKYYKISLDSEITDGDPLFYEYNYGSSINWAVDGDNLYAVIRDGQGTAHYFLRGAIPEGGETVILSDTGFKFTEPEVPDSWTKDEITGANGITDATARNGNLYFLYCQRHNYQTETRGFLYKIPDAAHMDNNSAAVSLSGWTDGDNHIPAENNDGQPFANKLYNPLRFVAVKPEKLYIADGGFSKTGSTTNNSDMNRIMVFDLLNSSSVKVHKDLGSEHQLAYGSGGYTAY